MTLRSTIAKPHVAAFICCSLLGVVGLVFVFVGIGGGFVKPEAYSLLCNVTARHPVRLNCVAQWDKYAADSRVYTDLCLCERAEVVVAGRGPSVTSSSPVATVDTVDIPNVGTRLPWETRRRFKRTDDCALEYPNNETFGCYWYPFGDSTTMSPYTRIQTKQTFGLPTLCSQSACSSFVAVLADCFIVFIKMCKNPCT